MYHAESTIRATLELDLDQNECPVDHPPTRALRVASGPQEPRSKDSGTLKGRPNTQFVHPLSHAKSREQRGHPSLDTVRGFRFSKR